MNIALVGFGTVGSGVYQIIKNNKKDNGLKVSHILIRSHKEKNLPEMTDNYQEILDDSKVDLIVEAIGGINDAYQYITQALKHGKNVVSANKAVIARYLDEFERLAIKNNVQFRFEASVGGGIPWISNLERILRIDEVNSLSGILNGTSNFILYQMKKTCRPLEDILKEAQDLGYAEADPTADLEGDDIMNKLCISTSLAYDKLIVPDGSVPKFGIKNINSDDIDYFDEHGLTVKLIGKSQKIGDEFFSVVEPTLYPNDSLLAHINNNDNLVNVDAENVGELNFIGAGAGQLPTADAIVQDILDIQESVPPIQNEFKSKLTFNPDQGQKNYVVRTSSYVDKFIDNSKLSSYGKYWIVRDISTDKMHSAIQSILKEDSSAFMASLDESAGEMN